MLQSARKMWGETGWGVPTSVALHLALAFLLLVRLPEHSPPAKDESINVELVPPPKREEKPEEKPLQKPKEVSKEQSGSQPQVFESASAEVDKEKPPQPQLPPAAPRAEKQEQKPAQASPAARTESAGKPSETKTALAELRVDAEDAVNKAEDAGPAPQSLPVPREKPVTEEAKADVGQKLAEAASELQSDDLVEAKELYSQDALSDPRVKQAIGRLPPKRRVVQLCTIEALEQVRRQRPDAFPDMLVPFGPVGGLVSASGLTASGGAFRSRSKWYAIDFKCEVNSETRSVVSFSFALGKAIPKSEWSARQLPTE
ncbi:hypothetical protein ABIE78_004111 [Sinorhizobium fredii]|uniref:Uncharacterized protein n=1 Tax=Sinorhizobium fredii (strain USDA 257) TaxID=1185652 RepID=I3X2J0_SINF2|nr:DUF930 domain-containing protein [Sinorhizobium fredii]AFL50096.1 hypothetical protein USDA257_c15060 [Sinorhizobium fredii USDA 257]